MLHRRKRNKMDPTGIVVYNKFLSTLDQNSLTKNNSSIKINNTPIEKENNNTSKKDDEIKSELDKIIELINNNFKMGSYSSTNFTGQQFTDSYLVNNIVDPNYYRDAPTTRYKNIYSRKAVCKIDKQKEEDKPPIEIRETINIEVEINNIDDILKLIDTYQNDPAIKYNINMKALHSIKEPLEELNNMIGMKDLKNNIVDQILYFVQELHKSNSTNGDFMHTVIYGPPGTGKTEIAKIMGKIYSKIGILSKGTFKKVTRSDLIAGYLGQTALKTLDVIKDALGGVLFIDEAYALGNEEKRDSFAKECIDTLCEALSDNKESLMVIIAGYENELKECFFNYNQGLDSRFTWRFKTDDYSAEDLNNIFLKKVKEIGWEIDKESKITIEWFTKNKEYLKFYGRDIETILAKTKIAHSRRVFCKPETEKRKLVLKDLDKGFEIYLKNENVKGLKEKKEREKYLYNTLYS
jgi:SpoVK/Ycf46/Vps4 family AAA+-type ATPase